MFLKSEFAEKTGVTFDKNVAAVANERTLTKEKRERFNSLAAFGAYIFFITNSPMKKLKNTSKT